MSSRSIQVIGGPSREPAWVDAATNALQVKVVNPGGGGGTTDVNITQVSGTAVGTSVPIRGKGLVDAGNSTTTPLGSLGIFLGTWVDALDYSQVSVAASSNVDSFPHGWILEWSQDGVNVDDQDFLSLGAGSRTYTINTRGRYFRVNYKNGSLAQTTFRLTTLLRAVAVGQDNDPIDHAINHDTLVVMTRSVIVGETTAGGGGFVNVKVNPSGTLEVNANQGTHDNLNANANLQVGNADVANGNPVPVSDAGGSLTVDGFVGITGTVTVTGTVATTQSTSPWIVGQATHANLNAQVRLQDKVGSGMLSVLQTGAAGNFPLDEYGLLPLFEVNDNPGPSGGTFSHGYMNAFGAIYVAATNSSFGVTQVTTPWVVGDGGGSLTVDGSVGITGTVSVGSVIPGTTATSLGKAEDAAHTTGDVGVMALAVRNDTGVTLAGTNGDYIPLSTDSAGHLRVFGFLGDGTGSTGNRLGVYADNDLVSAQGYGLIPMFEVNSTPSPGGPGVWSRGFISQTGGILVSLLETFTSMSVLSLVPGTTATELGKAEDAAHTTGDVGVMALAVRRDTLSSTTSANNDYATLNVDGVGALWVREYGVTTTVLSGSTRGRPIQITGTASGSANTIHTATTTSGQLDRVYVWLTNTSTSAITVTIEFGTTGTANELNLIVPAKETVLAVDGAVLGGAATDTIKAYASTGSVVNAFGRVERLTT